MLYKYIDYLANKIYFLFFNNCFIRHSNYFICKIIFLDIKNLIFDIR